MKTSFIFKKSFCFIIATAILMSLLPLQRVNAAEPQTDPTRNTIMAGWKKAALIYNNTIYEWNMAAPVPTAAATQYTSPNELGFRELDYMVVETGTSLGAASTCYATLSGGVVTVGGANRYGLRGEGVPYQNNRDDTTTTTMPIPANIVQIGVGGYHILALDGSGKVWSWGRNNFGQLGNGSYISNEYDYGLAHGNIRGIQTPAIISALEDKTITYIAAGDSCSFAIDSNKNVYGWGSNRFGQLGLGDITDRYTPTQIPELSGKNIIKIMSGGSHSIALTADGRIYAWGDNSMGELGLGYFNIGEPVVKTPTLIEYLTNVKNIGKGIGSSYAVTEDGRYWGWGRNEEKIVDGSGEMKSIPVHIFPASIYNSNVNTTSEGSAQTRYIYLRLVKDLDRSFNSVQPQNSDFTFNAGSYGTYTVQRAWKINEYECIIAATYPSENQGNNYNISLAINGRLFKNGVSRVIPYWGQAPYANQLPGEQVSEADPGIEKWKYLPQRFVEGSPSTMTVDYNISGASFTNDCTPENIRLGQSLLRGFTIKSATLLNGNQTARLVIEYDGSDNDNSNSDNSLNINLRDEIPIIFNSSTNSLGVELNNTAFRYFAADDRVSLGISSDNLDGYFIPEGAENGRYIIVSLVGSTFKDSINASAFTFSNLPEGVSIDYSKTVRVDNHNVKFYLQGNRTKDFDSDISNTSVSCPTSEIIEDNSTILTANAGSIFKAANDSESITIQNDPDTNGGIINEGSEDGEAILITLTGGTFTNALNKDNWTVTNLPAGVSLGAVQRVDDTHVKLLLSGNRNGDYDSNITNVTVACTTAEYNDSTSGSSLTDSSGVTLTASSDAEVLTISNNTDVNGGRIYEGRENGTEIIAAITGGVFSNPVNSAGWTVANLPAGVSLGAVQRVDDTHVKIILSGNRTVDYTGNINNVTITCGTDQFSDSAGNAALMKDTGVVLRKNPLSITINNPTVNIYKNGSGTITIIGTYGNTEGTDTTISSSIDGKIQTSTLSEPDGTWQLDWSIASLGIREGNFKDLIITAADSYGNSKAATYTGDIVVDITTPDTIITSSPAAITSSASASFTFTSDDGSATFEGSLDGEAYSVCTSPIVFTGLADGSHVFSTRAIDALGNADPTPATYAWTVDTTAPDTTITGSPAAITSSASASFTFASNEGSATFEGSLDGEAYSSCSSPVEFTGLAEGSHTFSVRAIDAAGNVDPTPVNYTWKIDIAEPTVAVTGVTLSKSALSLTENGASATLTATVMPEDATNKNIAWNSNNPAVATVVNGVITPEAAGTAVITVTTEDGSKTASCTVTVNPQPSEEDATISPDRKVFYLNNPSDIITFVSWGSAQTVTAVVYGTDHLSTPDAYTVSGNELTIKEAYISGLNLTAGDTREFEIFFDIGDNAVLTIEAAANGTSPTAKDPVPVQTVMTGESTDFNASDIAEDGEDPLTITAIKNNPASETATADLDNGTITITGLSAGSTSVTVAVSDGTDTVDVTVPIIVTAPQILDYTLTITSGTGGSVTTGSSGNYAAGTVITITATPASGYSFNNWTSTNGGTFDNANSAGTTFTMPANATTIVASFTYNGSGGNDDDRDKRHDRDNISTPAPTPKNVAIVTGTGKSETTLPITVNTNTGIAEVDLGTLTEDASTGEGITVVTIPSIPGANSYTLGISAASLSDSQGDGTLTLSTDMGSITMPDNMLSGISGISGKEAGITIGYGDKSDLPDEVKIAIGKRPIVKVTLTVDGKQTEWNNPDAPVTVAIPYVPTPAELADPEYIVIWYINGSGNVVSVPNGRYDPATGTVTFTTTHFSYYAVAYVHKTFNDLESAAWAKKSIEVLASKGILKGTSEEEYAPHGDITRADFLYFLVRTLGIDAKVDGNFQDIDSDAYYYKEIAIAKNLGITSGTGDNKFSPDASITRQDMMALTVRALRIQKKLKEQGTAPDLERFADKSLVASYAVDSVATVVKEGLIVGNGSDINPLGNTTRAEGAVLLYRIYNKYH